MKMSNMLKYALSSVTAMFAGVAAGNIYFVPHDLSEPVKLGLMAALSVVALAGIIVAVKAGMAEHRRINLRKRVDDWVENGGREKLEAAQAEAKKNGLLLQASLMPDLETLRQPMTM